MTTNTIAPTKLVTTPIGSSSGFRSVRATRSASMRKTAPPNIAAGSSRLVVVNISGLQRKNGSLLPSYTEEELDEATFAFVKYYVQGEHYDELVEENKKLRYELEQEISWRNRTDSEN